MKVQMTAILGITALLTLFVSCSSIPLPGTPTESLFILSGELVRDLGNDINGHGHTTESIRISVVNLETGKEKEMLFTPSKKYVSTTLEPGRYALNNKVRISVKYKGGNHINQRDEYIQPAPFLIEESTVFISPVIVKMSPRNGWYTFSSYYSISSSNVVRKRAMEELFDERRYKAWELYQLIGWDVEEE